MVVGTESMARNPIAAFDHRGGFRLGAGVGFKDFMWESVGGGQGIVLLIENTEAR